MRWLEPAVFLVAILCLSIMGVGVTVSMVIGTMHDAKVEACR